MRSAAAVLLFTFTVLTFKAVAADTGGDLVAARDRQDLPALDAAISAATAQAQQQPGSAQAQYKAALAYSYAAEVAMELRDKKRSASYAQSGLALARKAESVDGNRAEYHRLTGELCGQVIPANPLLGGLKYGQCARDEVNRAIQIDGQLALAYVSRGVGNYYLPQQMGGGPELAIQDFDKALSIDPKLADAYLWKGLALKKVNRPSEARAAFDRALALDPNRLWARQELDKTPVH
jgi:tetratricopeptide (TPR) repeat protein